MAYDDLAELPGAVARAAQGAGPRYVMAYWPGFDTVSHRAGPYSADAAHATGQVDTAFQELLKQVPRDGSTLVILTADHGQSETPVHLARALHEDPELMALLDGPPAGENLVRYLSVRPGAEGQLAARLGGTATLLRASDAWRDGLFGGSPAQENFLERTGDWIAVAHRGHQLTCEYPAKAARLGRHARWLGRGADGRAGGQRAALSGAQRAGMAFSSVRACSATAASARIT